MAMNMDFPVVQSMDIFQSMLRFLHKVVVLVHMDNTLFMITTIMSQ